MEGISRRQRYKLIRQFFIIILLAELIEITSGTRLEKIPTRWHRHKRQHRTHNEDQNHLTQQQPPATSDSHQQHYHQSQASTPNRAHPNRHSNLIVPQDVSLGADGGRYEARDAGRWGPWGPSSACSRTCGGGVASQSRQCHDVRPDGAQLCHGPNKKYLSCNTLDCPEDSIDFRTEQCSRYNNVPFDNRYYDWVPYDRAPNKCELNCMPKNENFYYRHSRRVIDGTRCDSEVLDVCVDGICMPVGCDLMLGSEAKEDKCRVCGGDGSTCKTQEGIFDTETLQVGYNDILLIPKGATNIVIQERKATNNYLAIRNLTGHYYLNGNWRIDFPRDSRYAGTTFHYERRPHGFVAPESIRALGPTTEPIFIVLLYQEPNAGVTYEYSVPTVISSLEPDTYSWVYGNYNDCSQSCAGGFQIRNVSCAKASNFEMVPDYLCDPLLKPPANRTCNTQACPATWHTGEWEECAVSCGSGTQYRIVYCNQVVMGSMPSLVKHSECESSGAGPRPAHTQPCEQDGECPSWHSSPWSACDKMCGFGKQARSVTCQRNATGTLEIFPDVECKRSKEEKPAVSRQCDAGPCEGVDWIVSDWTGCDSCSLHAESRQALCSSQSGTLFPDSICDGDRIPELLRDCPDSPPCDVMWYATQWSECSSKCGAGVETRDVFCATVEKEMIKKVQEGKCDASKKYSERQNCTVEACKGMWFVGPWDRCTAPCGAGSRLRKVLCLDGDSVVDTKECDASTKPLQKEQCNIHSCDDDEIMILGGCKDSKHGCCPDGVTAAGANYEGCPATNSTGDCATSEFGCCADGVTPAMGPFRKGCLKVNQCHQTKFNCCKDGVTPAKGPDYIGCPEPESCAFTAYGCCPDGVSAAEGSFFAGCDFLTTKECITSEFGCCPDGTMSAEGSGFEGCGQDDTPDSFEAPGFRDLEMLDLGSGQCDNITASGYDGDNCFTNTTTEPTLTSLDLNATDATLFDGDCENSTFGCCQDNISLALGPDGEGCANTTNCTTTEHGCCPDGTTEAGGPNGDGCPVEVSMQQPRTADEQPCDNSAYGCCPDSITDAQGPNYEGCVTCLTSPHGCCPDGYTPAQGPSHQGCSCPDQFGCCPGTMIPATGPKFEGCPSCAQLPFGCCYDQFTHAKGPYYDGCACDTFPYGCCPDGITFARGPSGEGCGCHATHYGCCPDGHTTAQGPGYQGCNCSLTHHGCCPDQHHSAHGPNYEGCPCSSFPHGCCPDGRTPARGLNFEGCTCETWYYGCCPDGRTPARGSNNEGCSCEYAAYGCCPDGVTTALGTALEGCPQQKQTKAGDVCGLPKERGECRNFTVKWFFDMDYGGCSRFWYGGCDGNDNRFDSQEECQQVCVAPEGIDACLLPRVVGPCDAHMHSYFYDTKTSNCQQFNYSGCLGNNNRFASEQLCQETCQKPHTTDPCMQPRVEGPCRGRFPRFYFDTSTGTCKDFNYGGCKGNHNNFESTQECEQQCAHRSEKEVCVLPRERGSCSGHFPRWYYDVIEGLCKEFHYGGCLGNRNRFLSLEKCETTCSRDGSSRAPAVVEAGEKCHLPRAEGPCREYTIQWYFDKESKRCGQFYYGGCEGNTNRFETEELCMRACDSVTQEQPETAVAPSPTDVCTLPHDLGSCNSYEERWFHDVNYGRCRSFIWSGCGGNDNNFGTLNECEQRCAQTPAPPRPDPAGGIAVTADDFLPEYCQLEKDAGPCYESQQRWHYDKVDGVCKVFQYGGCHGNGNRFNTRKECEDRCSSSQDICSLPKVVGPCSGSFRQWHHDSQSNKCEEILYGGCEGNANRFDSPEECESRCIVVQRENEVTEVVGQDICSLPSNPGPCLSVIQSWFYDKGQSRCLPFTYGGCEGNANRFESQEDCEKSCGDETSGRDVCTERQDPGPCIEHIPKWYYDSADHSCKQFIYGGCHGNGNRFSSSYECEATCLVDSRYGAPEPANHTGTCEDPTECYILQCPYGIEQFRDEDSCAHCRCTDPCQDHACPDDQKCAVEQRVTEDGDPRIEPVCRSDTKAGECPAASGNNSATCSQDCRSDADCFGDRKCCFNGCGYSCTELHPHVPEQPEAPAPEPEVKPETEEQPLQPSEEVVPPHIVAGEPEVVTSSGSSVTIRCTAHGFPRPQVAWQRAGNTIDFQAEHSRFRLLPDGSLQILETKADDAGNYVCVAINAYGAAEKATRLVIQDPVASPATIDVGVKVVMAPLDEPCMLHCKARGWPRPSVTWWRQSLMLPRFSENYEQYPNYTLLIRTVRTQDLGPYECRAFNGIGQVAIWEVTVYLDGPPILDPNDAKLKYYGPEGGGPPDAPARQPTFNYQPDQTRDHQPDPGRDHQPDQTRDHHSNPTRDHQPDPTRDHHSDPTRDHQPDPTRDHHSDSTRDHHSDPTRDHHSDPTRDHQPDPTRDHQPDPTRDHHSDPTRDHQPDPTRDHHSDPTRDHQPDPTRDHHSDPTRTYQPEPRRDHHSDPNREYHQTNDGLDRRSEGPYSAGGGEGDPSDPTNRRNEHEPSMNRRHPLDNGRHEITTSPNLADTLTTRANRRIAEDVTAEIGSNRTSYEPDSQIQIDCMTKGSLRTLWYKDGALIHTDDRLLVFANGTLLIKKALPMDSGTYKCVAANYHNEATASTTIKIEGVSVPEECTDNPYFANCKLIVKAKYCNNKYYQRFCCRSCAVDGQLSADEILDIKNSLV